MASEVKDVRIGNRTETSLDLEILLENSEVLKFRLNSITGATIIKAIVENGPYPRPDRAGGLHHTLDFVSYGFGTSPSAEGRVALAFQLSPNRYPVAIRVPQAKLPDIRAAIAQWETLRPGQA